MWHTGLKLWLWWWHPMWVTVHVLAIPVLTQFPANVSRKAAEDSLSIWEPSLTWESQMEIWAADFGLAQHRLLGPCGSQTGRSSLLISPSIPSLFPHVPLSRLTLLLYLSPSHPLPSLSLPLLLSPPHKILRKLDKFTKLPSQMMYKRAFLSVE